MQKVIVIGCPGSGKSTFSGALHRATGLPLVHLDRLFWNADRTTVERTVFRARLDEALQREDWIIDGNYASTMELRMEACDTVFFLDYPTELCLEGIAARVGQPRSDLPWVEAGETDAEFVEFVHSYAVQNRPQVLALLERYAYKNIFIFTDRSQADAFLAGLQS